jgi:excisionase family DNA binding protein
LVSDETAALPALLTIDEVAAMLRQSRGSIYRKIAAGELEAVRLGRSRSSPLRIRAAALDTHLRPVESDPPQAA